MHSLSACITLLSYANNAACIAFSQLVSRFCCTAVYPCSRPSLQSRAVQHKQVPRQPVLRLLRPHEPSLPNRLLRRRQPAQRLAIPVVRDKAMSILLQTANHKRPRRGPVSLELHRIGLQISAASHVHGNALTSMTAGPSASPLIIGFGLL